MQCVYSFDDTYKKIYSNVLLELPTYLKWHCYGYDEEDENENNCSFYRVFVTTVLLKPNTKEALKTFKSVSCLECLENCVIDDIVGMTAECSHPRANIPYDMIRRTCQKLSNGAKLHKNCYFTVTMQHNQQTRMFEQYRVYLSTKLPSKTTVVA
jgi:hypothetical protein